MEFADVYFAYPGGPLVLRDVDLQIAPGTRVAVVGETGSGKTTFAKLLTRLMDPAAGAVRLAVLDLRTVSFASLRRRVVLVPQEGFLFDSTLLANARTATWRPAAKTSCRAVERARPGRLARRAAARADTRSASAASPSVAGRAPAGRAAPGPPRRPGPARPRRGDQRGRPGAGDAHRARAGALMSGRTSVTIAHRLSTAENADEVIVFDRGRVVQRGPHAALVRTGPTVGPVYGRLHASWVAQQAR